MNDKTAFAIVKELKAAGYDVSIRDAPKGRPPPVDANSDDLAVTGAAGMGRKDAEACAAVCRKHLRKSLDGYALDTTGRCKQYPDAAFAAW